MNKRKFGIVSVALALHYYCANRVSAAVDEGDISYHFFARSNANLNESVLLNRTNRMRAVKGSTDIVMIIHGWSETWQSPYYDGIKDGFLSQSDRKYDVIQVDWSGPASGTYWDSAANTSIVGKLIGDFIVEVSAGGGPPLERFHVVGHSLGGQTAGAVGKRVVASTGSKVGRITALDPAGPLFSSPLIWHQGLDKDDARVVVVIHTDGGFFGHLDACGTADLYPNGGSALQPGCPSPTVQHSELVYCSHHKSKEYFVEMLHRTKIYATQCNSYGSYLMGWCRNNTKIDIVSDISPQQTGKFYFRTKAGEYPAIVSD